MTPHVAAELGASSGRFDESLTTAKIALGARCQSGKSSATVKREFACEYFRSSQISGQ
jgi:hypothetical protein